MGASQSAFASSTAIPVPVPPDFDPYPHPSTQSAFGYRDRFSLFLYDTIRYRIHPDFDSESTRRSFGSSAYLTPNTPLTHYDSLGGDCVYRITVLTASAAATTATNAATATGAGAAVNGCAVTTIASSAGDYKSEIASGDSAISSDGSGGDAHSKPAPFSVASIPIVSPQTASSNSIGESDKGLLVSIRVSNYPEWLKRFDSYSPPPRLAPTSPPTLLPAATSYEYDSFATVLRTHCGCGAGDGILPAADATPPEAGFHWSFKFPVVQGGTLCWTVQQKVQIATRLSEFRHRLGIAAIEWLYQRAALVPLPTPFATSSTRSSASASATGDGSSQSQPPSSSQTRAYTLPLQATGRGSGDDERLVIVRNESEPYACVVGMPIRRRDKIGDAANWLMLQEVSDARGAHYLPFKFGLVFVRRNTKTDGSWTPAFGRPGQAFVDQPLSVYELTRSREHQSGLLRVVRYELGSMCYPSGVAEIVCGYCDLEPNSDNAFAFIGFKCTWRATAETRSDVFASERAHAWGLIWAFRSFLHHYGTGANIRCRERMRFRVSELKKVLDRGWDQRMSLWLSEQNVRTTHQPRVGGPIHPECKTQRRAVPPSRINSFGPVSISAANAWYQQQKAEDEFWTKAFAAPPPPQPLSQPPQPPPQPPQPPPQPPQPPQPIASASDTSKTTDSSPATVTATANVAASPVAAARPDSAIARYATAQPPTALPLAQPPHTGW